MIGEPVVIGGRRLSLSRAVRAGDFVFLTGQVPLRDGAPMTDGTIEERTHVRIGTPKAHIVGGAPYLERRYASREGWMVLGGARGIVGG